MPGNLDPEVLHLVVRRTAELLKLNYVFPEIGEKMAGYILAQFEEGAYDSIINLPELGEELTFNLREIMNDLHLVIYYNPEEAGRIEKKAKNKSKDRPDTHWWDQKAVDNFGIQKLEILAGNIGYLNILRFAPVSLGGQRAAAAMDFLSDCDALIFDLRECGGGDPFMVQLFESYLFHPKPKLLLSLYDRPDDETQQIWTLPHVPGKRMPDVPVYILTSGQTFSGGEDFAYTTKHHGRATIVGEKTDGGGHTIEFKSIGEGFVLVLPTGRPIHPVTGSNWEGVGVLPDIAVPREQALQKAHLHALETLLSKSEREEKSRYLESHRARLKALYEPLKLDGAYLKKLTGVYGRYAATLTDGQLTLSGTDSRDSWQLIPMTETLFIVDEEYNARFEFDEEGQATALVWLELASGREIRSPKKSE